ncbi:hypothetical protein E4T38_01281 [Aureobasidium subglaciale]|nr:hypothetical protein E4T38_01281 [Aureobasidium subglaciale]KAI5230298.1 hypothetical protein E4T40_01282 [Aureobasidium subglaciale]KAI5233579.1 hypothetical protein E4T41_01280 [Aureobasidium subglaciale]KAI5266851.1 hypothetical protein E4T46_01280 [Aureobasidium subglaciale]
MDPRTAQTSKADVGLLLAKGKLVGCLTTGQSKRSTLDSSDINSFHNLLQIAIKDTSRSTKEFKKCVAWIVCHVAKSRRRVAAFGDYLLKLVYSLLPSSTDLDQLSLLRAGYGHDLLQLLDAVFFRIHLNPGQLLRKSLETYTIFAKAIEPTVFQLVEFAAPSHSLQALQFHQDLACLLNHWTQQRLFTNRIRLCLRSVARKAYVEWLGWLRSNHLPCYVKLVTKRQANHVEDDVSITHGQPQDAWHDLPAGTMVQAMKSTKSGHPVNTARIKPIVMPTGSLDSDIMETVLEHIQECKDITSIPNLSTTDDEFALNGLGLRLSRDPMANHDRPEFRVVEGYYGFSVPFMKTFQNLEENPPSGPERPLNWAPPPPPPEFAQSPPFQTSFSPNAPLPPPGRDVSQVGGGSYRQHDYGRGNGAGWRGGETRGGGGGAWRGRGRGGNNNGGSGPGGYRPY